MQVNVNESNLIISDESIFIESFSFESEEDITKTVSQCAEETWKQFKPELKKALAEESNKKIDLLASSVTAPLTGVITAKSPELVASIVNPMIESSVKNTSKKVANCAIDKCIDRTEKSIPSVIDYSSKSTQSFFGYISSFIISPSSDTSEEI